MPSDSPQEPAGSPTLEQIEALLSGFKAEITDMVTGMGQKQNKAQIKAMQAEIGSAVKTELAAALDGIIPAGKSSTTEEAAVTEVPAEQINADDKQDQGTDLTGRFQRMLQQQSQAFEKRLQETQSEYKKRLAAMQEAVDQERLNTAKSRSRDRAIDPIRERLHNPDLLWAYLEQKGISYDSDKGSYGISADDEFGNPVFTPLSDILSSVESDAPYLFKPRPGSGLDSQPGGHPQRPMGGGIYASGVTEQDRVDTFKNAADPIAAIVQQLQSS